MSFLSHLKSQASALQNQNQQQSQGVEECTRLTELACKMAWGYLQELAPQLNVLTPAAPRLTLDGKTPWPAMRLAGFRIDARKKLLRNKEVFDYLNIGWQLVPQQGAVVTETVTVNFPPDLQRVEGSLHAGNVKYERHEVRHPQKNSLQAYRFAYQTEARGSVTITPDHDRGGLAFRLLTVQGFGVKECQWPAAKVNGDLMDELAKLLVQQPSHFL